MMNSKLKWILLTVALILISTVGIGLSVHSADLPGKALQITGEGAGKLNAPMGVTADNKRIYVADANQNRIAVFDTRGKWLFNIGRKGQREGELNYPVDAALNPKGGLYVADFYNQRIQVFSPGGQFRFSFPQGERIRPTALDIDRNGNVFVTDINSNSVRIYTEKGKLIRSFGETGEAEGKFKFPNGIAVSRDGSAIYVADSQNARIQVFTGQGLLQRIIRTGVKMGLPKGMSLSGNRLYMADAFLQKIFVFDLSGKLVNTIGQSEGALHFPNDVYVTDKQIYVADRGNNRIMVYPTR